MQIRRIATLLKKELSHGAKSYFFIYALVAPLAGTLLVHLIFGSLFSATPRLGVYDAGDSEIVGSISHLESINWQSYSSAAELKHSVKVGARDVGIVFPKGFDVSMKEGKSSHVQVYIWGESLLKNRAMVSTTILQQIRNYSGRKLPLDISAIPVGDRENIPIKDRFIPAIVLMAIFISGFAIPSTSLVQEKEKGTLGALIITPVTQMDVFLAKGTAGTLISMLMGILILVLNQSLGSQIGLTILLLFLGAIMATSFGLILGAFMKEISSVYSAIQALGIFIYTPGIVYIFPGIPNWIGKFFPTYYVMTPILDITRGDGNWATIQANFFILLVILGFFLAVVAVVAVKTRQQVA